MGNPKKQLKLIDIDAVKRAAKIIGKSSAAQQSLNEMKERTDKGETVYIFTSGNFFIVGPMPDPHDKTVEVVV